MDSAPSTQSLWVEANHKSTLRCLAIRSQIIKFYCIQCIHLSIHPTPSHHPLRWHAKAFTWLCAKGHTLELIERSWNSCFSVPCFTAHEKCQAWGASDHSVSCLANLSTKLLHMCLAVIYAPGWKKPPIFGGNSKDASPMVGPSHNPTTNRPYRR